MNEDSSRVQLLGRESAGSQDSGGTDQTRRSRISYRREDSQELSQGGSLEAADGTVERLSSKSGSGRQERVESEVESQTAAEE